MQRIHHTLKRDLTNTLLIWSGIFFALLGIIFLLTFHTLENYLLDLTADHRLDYQTREFAKHLDQQDTRSIHEESDALIQEQVISAILMVDASGELMHVSLSQHQPPQLQIQTPINLDNIHAQIDSRSNLHLYQRKIPGHNTSLVLILDDRPIETAIFSATASSALLMLLLLIISIRALHSSLKRRLVLPVDQLRKAVGNDSIDASVLHQLEESLPEEASEILHEFDHLKHVHDDLKTHITKMFESLPACFWWSFDGKVYAGISGKSDSILNRPLHELYGMPLWEWTQSGAHISGHRKQLQYAIDHHGEYLDFSYQLAGAKTSCWYGETITICYDNDGKLDIVYGIISDITSRKERQHEQAKQRERMHHLETIATLAGGIAHEFNNTLAGMNGNIFLIKQSTTNARMLERIQCIEQLIERSADMIESMLSYAQKSSLRPEPIDLVRFLEEFRITVLTSLPDRIRFNLQINQPPETDGNSQMLILADQKKLQEVLMQFIDNAQFAVEDTDKPYITITARNMEADEPLLRKYPNLSSRQLVCLQIQDNGCGMPENIRNQIFDPFFTTREVGKGTGLGLSMAYGYIHQIGGAIDVKSHDTQGTVFNIYLPMDMKPLLNRRTDTLLQGHGEKFLVVDDEQVFRESTCEVLKYMGYRPIEAWGGKEAVQLFEQHQDEIRLIIMDILMPDMNGIQASRRIREIRPDIPVIFLTAYDRYRPLENEVYEEYAELMNKPFRISTLSQTIQKMLKKVEEQKKT